MTFAAEQNQVSNVCQAWKLIGRGEWASFRKKGCRLCHQRPGPKPERNSAGWQASASAAREA